MTRVEKENQARHAEEARDKKVRDEATMKAAKEKFSQAMGQQQAGAKQSAQQNQAAQQKNVLQKNAAAALMARQGVQNSGSFEAMLKTSTQEGAKRAEGDTKNRTEDMKDKQVARSEDNQETNRQQAVAGDKLAAIDRDQQGSGGGGFSGGSGGGSDGGNHREGLGGIQGMAQAEQAQASHAPNAPKLPEAVLQELVKRVMAGVDAKGMGTFVVQLKDDVLGGASMMIAADGGKISAKFTVNDDNTARLLKASEGALARAFGHKGMQLESMTVERR